MSAVHETLGTLPEDTFITTLPHLRLAFSDLTPREADAVAHAAAELAGAPAFATGAIPNATESDLLLGLRTNTVEVALHRALAVLRVELAPEPQREDVRVLQPEASP